LNKAELEASPWAVPQERWQELETFRARAEELGAFGAPPAPPLTRSDIAALGFEAPAEAHRAANALRYFRLRSGLLEEEWFRERLRWESQQPRGRLNLLIGPAGSGKSMWAQEHMAHTRVVSSDRMRAILTGDPADQSQNYLVFQRCMDQLRTHLKRGEAVTFDATNYMEELRESPIRVARWCAAEIHSYFFDVTLETALKRNEIRSRRVPEQVIRRHYRLLTPPALYEADWQWVVDSEGRLELLWPKDIGEPAPRMQA
jgi:predicted kinase